MEMSRQPEVGNHVTGDVPFIPYTGLTPPGEPQGEITNPAQADEHLPAAEQAVEVPTELSSPEHVPALHNGWDIVVKTEPHGISEDKQKELRDYFIEHTRHAGIVALEGEDDMTQEELDTIIEAADVVIQIAEEAGVDTSVHRYSYHIMPDSKTFRELRDTLDSPPTNPRAFHDYRVGVVMNRALYENDSPAEFTHIAVHETVHLAAKKMLVYGIEGPGTWGIAQGIRNSTNMPYGSKDEIPGRAFDESIAEMCSYAAMRRLGMGGKFVLPGGYEFPTILLDSVIVRAAHYHDVMPQEIEDGIYRAHFGGDWTGMRRIEQAIGPECTETLWNIPFDTSPLQRHRILKMFDSGRARENTNRYYDERKMPSLFPWQKRSPPRLIPPTLRGIPQR